MDVARIQGMPYLIPEEKNGTDLFFQPEMRGE
jgi:hypothetical protein